MTDLGRLEPVENISSVWPHEALDFTPWLAEKENMKLLSDAVGISLTLDRTEMTIGQRRLDMLAHTVDGSAVLIENQYCTSDEGHLGALFTYSAELERIEGIRVKTVIWIAEDFDDANRSGIRWVNERTGDSAAFLAVRIRLVKIGDSQPAPVFDVVEQPEDWDRRKEDIVWRSGLSEKARSRLGFWSYYRERYPDDGVPADRTGDVVECCVAGWSVRVALGLYEGEAWIGFRPGSDQDLERLQEREDVVLENLDVELKEKGGWLYPKVLKFDVAKQPDNWPDLVDWLHRGLGGYRGALTG